MRFDRFTERAQDAAARAYEIVQRFGHTQVDTEHLFLALLEQNDGAIPQLLDHIFQFTHLLIFRLEILLPPLRQILRVRLCSDCHYVTLLPFER